MIRSIALASLISTQVLAGTLPDGAFKGKGIWKSETTQGSYTVSSVISGTAVDSKFTLSDGSQKEWKFDMDPTSAGFFHVKVSGLEVGHGYCLEKVQVCHYEVKIEKLVLEETVTAMEGKLYRFGSKDEGSGRIVWQESMSQE